MNISKQLERLRQRVNQLSITKSPPSLRMVMIKDDDMPIDLSEWDLAVKIEQPLLALLEWGVGWKVFGSYRQTHYLSLQGSNLFRKSL